MDVNVRECAVPGVGRSYQLPLGEGTTVTVMVETASGVRELSALGPGEDEPQLRVRLGEAHALTLAAMLSGVRFVFESDPSDAPAGGVHVETVTVGAGSPAVGHLVDDLELPDPEGAQVLAVIRDDTPELVEDDATRPCQPGDRLVVAGHPEPLHRLRSFLAG
jgi:TrkA domain protein